MVTLGSPLLYTYAMNFPDHYSNFIPQQLLADAQRLFAISPLFTRLARNLSDEQVQELFVDRNHAVLPDASKQWVSDCDSTDLHVCMQHLRQCKQRGMRHIIWWEMGVHGDIVQSFQAISDFASILLDQALAMSVRLLSPRFGTLENARFCVIGLGKLGGRELNLGSDIDPLFIWDGEGQTSGGRNQLGAKEYFDRLSKMLIRLMAEGTGDGMVWPMDMRLRPGGDGAAVSLSLDATLDFYLNYGQTWERAMLIKARPVAGDMTLGKAFIKGIEPFIYRRYLDYSTVSALADMKQRIDHQAGAFQLQQGFDVKRGWGGIREIEFIIQSMQLLHGGSEKALKIPSSLPALDALVQTDVLKKEDAERMRSSYLFWRQVEHAVQARLGEQTQKLPDGYVDYLQQALAVDDIEACLRQHQNQVRELFVEHVLPVSQSEQQKTSWLMGSATHPLLQALDDDSQQRIAAALAAIDAQLLRGMLPERSREQIDQFLNLAMPRWLDDANRIAAVESFAELISTIAGRATWIDLIASHKGAREWLIGILAASRFISGHVAKNPSLLEWPLSFERGRAEIDRLVEQMANLSLDDEEEFLSGLGKCVEFARIHCALSVDAHQADPLKVGGWMADIADAAVQACVKFCIAQIKLPEDFPFVALAMGKHGSREMGLVSDLDMVFVLADDSRNEINGRSSGDWGQRLGRRVIRQLTGIPPFGAGYEFDARLRPSGNKGVLVIAIDGFESYQLTEAHTWEHQALCRARTVAGPEHAQLRVREVIKQVIALPRDEKLLKQDVCEMRQKMFDHLSSHSDDFINLKHDHGGVVDIEFIAQASRLLFATPYTSTVETLRAIPVDAPQVWKNAAEFLADSFIQFRQMENVLRTELWKSVANIPNDEKMEEWETFRRHAEIKSPGDLSNIMKQVHETFRQLMTE